MSTIPIMCTACGQVHPANTVCPSQIQPSGFPWLQPVNTIQPVQPQGFVPYQYSMGQPFPGFHFYPGETPYPPQPMAYWNAPVAPSPAMRIPWAHQQSSQSMTRQSNAAQATPGLSEDDITRIGQALQERSSPQSIGSCRPGSPATVQHAHISTKNTSSESIDAQMLAEFESMKAELKALKDLGGTEDKSLSRQAASLVSEPSTSSVVPSDAQSSYSTPSKSKKSSKRVDQSTSQTRPVEVSVPSRVVDESAVRRALIKGLLGPIIPLIHISQTAMNIVREFGDGDFDTAEDCESEDEKWIQELDPLDNLAECDMLHPTDTCGKLFQVSSYIHDRNPTWDERKPGLEICSICTHRNDLEAARRHLHASHGVQQWYEHPDNVNFVEILKTAANSAEVMFIVPRYFAWPTQQKKVPMPLYCYFPGDLPKPEDFPYTLSTRLAPALRDIEQDLPDALTRLIAFTQNRGSYASGTRTLEQYRGSEYAEPQKLVVSGRRKQKSRWRDSHWNPPK